MCYDRDARPPVPAVDTASVAVDELVLVSADGTAFAAFRADPARPDGAALVVLLDHRGLCPFYERLAVALAAHGHPAVVIDYFGRTAGTDHRRNENFPAPSDLAGLTRDGMDADLLAAARHVRERGAESVVALGFCLGGRLVFFASAPRYGLDGVIGFYGHPGTGGPYGPGPAQHASELSAPILGLFGGADEAIPPDVVEQFELALTAAGVPHTISSYPGAPHGFFDVRHDEHQATCESAWQLVQDFLRDRLTPERETT
ncbi:dienelactone hydrolase family protein [Kibdelosporangium persicum]|uniref:Carboxymethylenebutenolidase n=1 Tax=Kibdelosporangium persicum TaxID=2698649 RepID=A0ABX2FE08_9PSEU|nr:dienelactone hydrolase family protein [Kibdelosporangium persicum]NRN69517.1 Carboxymethylenebutenolidase [Kibdelosporangium persicum]